MQIKKFPYNFISLFIICLFTALQLARWRFFPQRFDAYYHILTAWGFVKAGGYSAWDFWQYAPAGRPHIYPPLFHFMLAIPMKLGADKIFLARLFSVALPAIFLFTLWDLIRKHFSARLAILTLVAVSSSFSFFTSLADHMPSTLAVVFGILAFGEFFNSRFLRAGLLLALSFYTHIGTSWFIALGLFLYILLSAEKRRAAILSLIFGIALSLPVIAQQLAHIKIFALANFNEQYFCEFKTIDYILAAFGFALSLKKERRYRLFAALFIASFIYAKYPSRFFSCEGFLPVALLSAVSLDALCDKFAASRSAKILTVSTILFVLALSPTLAIKPGRAGGPIYKAYLFDSAAVNMLLRAPRAGIDYSAHKIIVKNSSPDDIIYCTEDSIGMALAALSGRAPANYLLPEVYSTAGSDPIVNSKIIIMLKYHSPEWVKERIDKYGLQLIGKTSMLDVYKNPSASGHIQIRRALIPFGYVIIMAALWLVLFCLSDGRQVLRK